MTLEIVEDGISPVKFDQYSKELPGRAYRLEDLVQTRGLFVGAASLFLSLGMCNLKCIKRDFACNFCFKKKVSILETQEVANIIRNNIGNKKHLVITGGEPLLQSTALIELLDLIKDLSLFITLETNGTIYNQELYSRVDYISVFPVLSVFTPASEKLKKVRGELKLKNQIGENSIKKHEQDRVNIKVLQTIIDNTIIDNARDTARVFSFTVYVMSNSDVAEFESDFLSRLTNWDPENITMVYYGLKESLELADRCIEEGYGFIPLNYFNKVK